jgi:hypothetical protein
LTIAEPATRGVAAELAGAVKRQTYVAQANTGLQQ